MKETIVYTIDDEFQPTQPQTVRSLNYSACRCNERAISSVPHSASEHCRRHFVVF